MLVVLILIVENVKGGDDDNGGDGFSGYSPDDVVDINDGGVDSNIVNDAKWGDGKSKFDFTEDTAGNVGNSNIDGGCNVDSVGDANDDGRDGDDSDDRRRIDQDDDSDDDEGNFPKNCFKNKEIDLKTFSLLVSTRWRKSLK